MRVWFFLAWLLVFPQECSASWAPVEVRCGSHGLVVTVHRDLFGTGKLVEPDELTLGTAACPPSGPADGAVVVFEAGLHECGSAVQMTPDLLIYHIQLFYKPSLTKDHPFIARSHGATFGLECHYPRKDNVTSQALRPTWSPLKATMSREGSLGFSLKLMTDDWAAERTLDRFVLGEPLRLQADVQAQKYQPLRVWVESCIASTNPMPTTSTSHFEVVGASGCMLDGRGTGVSSAFLAPRLRQETLRFTVDAFQFSGETQKLIYITCRLKVTPGDKLPDSLNKACSFDAAHHSWVPVEGPSTICDCCETRNCSGVMEEQDPRGTPDSGDVDGQRSLGELLPTVAKSTHPPFGGQGGSSSVSVGWKTNLGLPLEDLVQQGPVFSGVEGGSGFGDTMEMVISSVTHQPQPPQRAMAPASTWATARPSKAQFPATETTPALKGEELPSTMEDVATYIPAKIAKEVANTAAKDEKQPPEKVPAWPMLVSLMGVVVVGLLSVAVWLLVRRQRRRRRTQAPAPVTLELQSKENRDPA
ncbi:zona pellucida sperm-binding protein 3-like isoform X2 [Erythrolamprus reginae]|uniref:zona pellucida sperm-binding protein 3-like isoform X2 n=1 Tax=Erythrolamprus reginae TaxID=121349 RepID=UPI00396CB49C